MNDIVIRSDRFNELSQLARNNARNAVAITTFWIEGRIKIKMAEPKHGRVYEMGERQVSFIAKGKKSVSFTARKGKASRMHVASAPGEAPAVDTGALIGSVHSSFESGGLTGIISTPQKYAPVLEFGGVNVEARPAFVPAVEEARQPFLRRMAEILR